MHEYKCSQYDDKITVYYIPQQHILLIYNQYVRYSHYKHSN
jgi:hypothetical protein